MIEHEQYYRKGGTYELPIEIYNDLIGQIEEAQKERNDYKSRCEKANTYINEEIKKIQEHQYSTGVRRLNKIQNILNRSDEK